MDLASKLSCPVDSGRRSPENDGIVVAGFAATQARIDIAAKGMNLKIGTEAPSIVLDDASHRYLCDSPQRFDAR